MRLTLAWRVILLFIACISALICYRIFSRDYLDFQIQPIDVVQDEFEMNGTMINVKLVDEKGEDNKTHTNISRKRVSITIRKIQKPPDAIFKMVRHSTPTINLNITEKTPFIRTPQEYDNSDREAFQALTDLHKQKKIARVCVVGSNVRQRSMFSGGTATKFGRFWYDISKSCDDIKRSIHIISFVKCCVEKEFVHSTINQTRKAFDLIFVVGDEYCMIENPLVDARQYHTTYDLSGPLWVPLGPRYEFRDIDQKTQVLRSSRRKFLYNFVGSLSSASRRELVSQMKTPGWSSILSQGFIHYADKWAKTAKESNGYISPAQYRFVLMDSVFTLSPHGHNPESYRIYEACLAGSIPVMVLKDIVYDTHKCNDTLKALLNSNPPFVFLDSWDAFPQFLENIKDNETLIENMQLQVREWYHQFMSDRVRLLEDRLDKNFYQRNPSN